MRSSVHNAGVGPRITRAAMTRAEFLGLATAGLAGSALVLAGSPAAAQTTTTAPVGSLDDFYAAWQDRFNAADLDGLVDLYLEDVTHINPQGEKLTGSAAVRADFEGLFALKPQIDIHDRHYIQHGDTALTTNHWRMTLTDPDGKTQEISGGGIEVVQKQPDGGWRFILDDASRSAEKAG